MNNVTNTGHPLTAQEIAAMAKIEIKEMEKLDLAYVRSIGTDGISKAYDTLVKWAAPLGLLQHPTAKMVTIYHDSFKVTEAQKVRISACITLAQPIKATGEVGLTTLEKGRFIIGSFKIGLTEFETSWKGLFLWMAENGYKKAERDPFEIYHNDYRVHPENKCIVDFYIPILFSTYHM